MAKRVTAKDIEEMNIVYSYCHSYAETATATGWSASTVRKYVDPNYVRIDDYKREMIQSWEDYQKTVDDVIQDLTSQVDLTALNDTELASMPDLWKELVI